MKKKNEITLSKKKKASVRGAKTGYSGIDCFRFFAALLVITIHTSPLASINETADFLLTRVLARTAVPFFLMTSGFFLVSEYTKNTEKRNIFLKKTVLIYGAAILLYLPVNFYNGYFKMDYLLPNILKDLVSDGTLYHLWYLPASILGGLLAWKLVKKFRYPKALLITAALYLIGLFGDSYYGISVQVPVLKSFYGLVFQVTDYTRNGLFYAPVFFVMGGLLAKTVFKGRTLSLSQSLSGFAASLALLVTEALLLHHFKLQRHDSMYVFLLPCMYFLFQALLHFNGKRLVWLRTSSLLIYIIYPMVIVLLRMFAKLLHLQKLLIENSLVHFLLVSLLSVVISIITTAFWNQYKPKRAKKLPEGGRAWLDINFNNLEHNARVLSDIMAPGCKLMAVVKTQAYGHGAFEIATHLNKIGINAFAAATIEEGIQLRNYGIQGEILILGYTNVNRAADLKKYDLTQTLLDFRYAVSLNKQGIPVKAHIKIDTGMHRLGIESSDTDKVVKIFSMPHIKVNGMFTHLCCADSLRPADTAFTNKQIASFYSLADTLKENGIPIPKLHIQSTYGLLNYPDLTCDYARIGIGLYGVLSSPGDETILKPDLRPVLSLKSRIVLIRTLKKGETFGYGRNFLAAQESRIALLPIGYGDGFPRSLSCGNGSVNIGGQTFPIAGRICMDCLAVDITGGENIAVGDIATLIAADTDSGADKGLSAPFVAADSGSISNELLCRLGERVR